MKKRHKEMVVGVVGAILIVTVFLAASWIDKRTPEPMEPNEPVADQVQVFDLSILDSCGIITNGQRSGSCVAVGPDLILTAKHCMGRPGSWIEIGGVQYEILDGWWVSEEYDVGFVRIDGILPYVEFGQMPVLLDEIYVIGSPLWHLHPTCVNNITTGIVSNLSVDWAEWTDGIIVDAAAYPGNSGGPLLDANGKLIGIMVGCHNRHRDGGDNFWLAEPITHIKIALDEYNQYVRESVIESEDTGNSDPGREGHE